MINDIFINQFIFWKGTHSLKCSKEGATVGAIQNNKQSLSTWKASRTEGDIHDGL